MQHQCAFYEELVPLRRSQTKSNHTQETGCTGAGWALTCSEVPGSALLGSPGGHRAGQPPTSRYACLPLGSWVLLPRRPVGPLLTATKAIPVVSWQQCCWPWPLSRPFPPAPVEGLPGGSGLRDHTTASLALSPTFPLQGLCANPSF